MLTYLVDKSIKLQDTTNKIPDIQIISTPKVRAYAINAIRAI